MSRKINLQVLTHYPRHKLINAGWGCAACGIARRCDDHRLGHRRLAIVEHNLVRTSYAQSSRIAMEAVGATGFLP